MIKLAMMEGRIDTLVVTYTQAGSRGYTYRHLAEDPEDVQPIPGYGPVHGEPRSLIVAVGFESLGLRHLIDEYRHTRRHIEVLMPFPPGQPYSRRIWRTVQDVEIAMDGNRLHRVNAVDAFGTYDRIRNLVGEPTVGPPPALAPYGPKPLSLGMCMYALRNQSPVLYTQPRVYHPDYTVGVGKAWAYCLKYETRSTI